MFKDQTDTLLAAILQLVNIAWLANNHDNHKWAENWMEAIPFWQQFTVCNLHV